MNRMGESRTGLSGVGLACVLVVIIGSGLLAGCVLPGGDRPVGAMLISGQVSPAREPLWAGSEALVVVRRHGSLHQELDALEGIGDPACNPVTRRAAVIGSGGNFSFSVPSFLSGDPIWIIPPLGTLPLFSEPADKQGLVFLLRTPPPMLRTYEIDVRRDFPRIRMLKESQKGFRGLSDAERLEIAVSVVTIRSNSPPSFSWNLRMVSIQLTPSNTP